MKRNLFYIALILLCACVFVLYLAIHQSQTDTQPPTISFSGEMLAVSTQDPREALLQGVTAKDDVDGDVTDSAVVADIRLADKDGTIQVTYAAFDKAGNVTKAVRTAKYTDYRSPRFSLNASLTFAYNSRFDIFSVVEAEDVLDGDISHRIRITSLDESAIATVGDHLVELKARNSLGETVSLIVPVEVYAAGTYAATLTLTDYLIYLPVHGELNEEDFLNEYTRANTTVSLQGALPEGYSVEIESNVQPDVPGVYTVEYRATQTVGVGNNIKTYTGYAKLIVVVEG